MVAQCAPLQGIALMLALVLFASSLSAAAAFREGFYGGYYYELVGTCSSDGVYVRTSIDNRSYTAGISAKIYRYSNLSTTIEYSEKESSISLDIPIVFSPIKLISNHYINGSRIDTLTSTN